MGLASFPRRAALLVASLPLLVTPLHAQDAPEEEDAVDTIVVDGERMPTRTFDNVSAIVVTGARIRQGGAQDVQHFRSISEDDFASRGMPDGDSFTMEGLLGEYDLTLPSQAPCRQLFCVSAYAMDAQLTGREADRYFLGLGFDSNLDADFARAEPVSVIAVVDRSGSMSNEPIARVKEGLHAVIEQMREGDRLGIVIYGSTTVVHQPVVDVAGNEGLLHRAVDSIEIDGSTYMEAGLKLGYDTAFAELENSNGRTRLMLFTDENPNVGNTSAEGFMGQALAGSRRGVGLTTIGVATHYDGKLAQRISSVRGGNLFFLAEEGSGRDLFAREFENMITEVAHDLAFTIDPAPGYRVSGVFGVPGDLITEGADGTLTVTVGSAFLSSNGGGIYATLEGGSAALEGDLAEITVAYTDAATQRRESNSAVARADSGRAPENLAKAQLLVEEYLVIDRALALYHEEGDAAGANDLLAGLSERMASADISGMGEERKLVNRLRYSAARLAGIEGGPTLPWDVLGKWEVVHSARLEDIGRGDLVEITEYGEFITERMRGRDRGDTIYQQFAINERQLHIEDTRIVLEYSMRGDRLILRDRFEGAEIVLVRAS